MSIIQEFVNLKQQSDQIKKALQEMQDEVINEVLEQGGKVQDAWGSIHLRETPSYTYPDKVNTQIKKLKAEIKQLEKENKEIAAVTYTTSPVFKPAGGEK